VKYTVLQYLIVKPKDISGNYDMTHRFASLINLPGLHRSHAVSQRHIERSVT